MEDGSWEGTGVEFSPRTVHQILSILHYPGL